MLLITDDEYRELTQQLSEKSQRLRHKIALREPLDIDDLKVTEDLLLEMFKNLLLDTDMMDKLHDRVSFALRNLDALEFFCNEPNRERAKNALLRFLPAT